MRHEKLKSANVSPFSIIFCYFRSVGLWFCRLACFSGGPY